jgi:hemolysin III
LIITPAATFPRYTAVEQTADRVLHALAVPLAAGGIAWLFLATAPAGGARTLLTLTIYGVGLIGMFVASAAYNACCPGPRKERLRRIDHAMIFVMIAGTCTPFMLSAFPRRIGLLSCALVWIIAASGATLNLIFPRRFERVLLALYLGTGWTVFCLSVAYAGHFSNHVLSLLLAGGVAYSCGAFFHAQARLPFHNVAWHMLVLLGAGAHWAAVANQLMTARGP